jgi:Fe-Mn family superoxide dismutase
MTESNFLSRRDAMLGLLPAAGAIGGTLAGAGLLANSALMADDVRAVYNPIKALLKESFSNGSYTLPKLPYAYDALEPHIDAETMKLHHDFHHQGYVNGLNNTLKALADLRAGGGVMNADLLTGLEEALSFNGSGHLLHSTFWAIMSGKGGGEAGGAVGGAIARQFGSFSAFQAQFSGAAVSVKGSGWAVLAYEPIGDQLVVLQVKQHDLQTIFLVVPLLPLDVWEHAYYLKYKNKRADYVKAWWNVVNWPAVDAAYQSARKAAGHA